MAMNKSVVRIKLSFTVFVDFSRHLTAIYNPISLIKMILLSPLTLKKKLIKLNIVNNDIYKPTVFLTNKATQTNRSRSVFILKPQIIPSVCVKT